MELGDVKRVVIGYEDRFVRFGYDWFEAFCERHGTDIVTVFSARLPGLRSHINAIRAAALLKDEKV